MACPLAVGTHGVLGIDSPLDWIYDLAQTQTRDPGCHIDALSYAEMRVVLRIEVRSGRVMNTQFVKIGEVGDYCHPEVFGIALDSAHVSCEGSL